MWEPLLIFQLQPHVLQHSSFKGHAHVLSLDRRTLNRSSSLLSAGDCEDPAIPEWDTFTQKKVGHHMTGLQAFRHLIPRLVTAKFQAQTSKSMACFHLRI
jgi:hypothetical protein